MAPTQGSSQECGTGKHFFESVSRDNYPPAKSKAQPWKNFYNVNESAKTSQSDGKVIVACGLRHDYGKSGILALAGLETNSSGSSGLGGS